MLSDSSKGMVLMSNEIISGRNPVLEALRAGRSFQQVLITNQLNKQTQRELEKTFKQKNISMKIVPKQALDQLKVGNHQGIVAYVAPYTYASLDYLFKIAEQKDEQPFRSEEHTSELQSRGHLVCRLLLEKTNSATEQTP